MGTYSATSAGPPGPSSSPDPARLVPALYKVIIYEFTMILADGLFTGSGSASLIRMIIRLSIA